MMDCDGLIERLYAYLDGELEAVNCEEIQAHLDECEGCLQHADFERAVLDLVRRKCCEQAPEGLIERLRSAIDAERS